MAKDEEIRDAVLKQFKYMSELLGVDEIKRRLENIEKTMASMDKTLAVIVERMKEYEKDATWRDKRIDKASNLSKGVGAIAIILGTIASYLSFKTR